MKHKKIIIWGYKLYSHTHSYIHAGYYKGFKALGYDVYWLDKNDSVDSSFFEDALIFTEQWTGLHNIKSFLVKSSTYAVHYIGNKNNFIEGNPGATPYLENVGRLIDIRYNANKWKDKNYDYDLNRDILRKIGSGSYYQKDSEYDKFYTLWATDLLPEEINLDDRFIPKDNYIFYGGTIGGGQGGPYNCLKAPEQYDNLPYLMPFIKACEEKGIQFKYNCPWKSPQTFEEQKYLIQKSYLAPDFRHKAFLDWGYIPCRTFKNISYGQLGITNSKAVYDLFGGSLIYNTNTYDLFYEAEKLKNNFDLIKQQMLFVKDHHTYINRCKELLEVI